MGYKQCPYCGTNLEDNSIFCNICGKKIPESTVNEEIKNTDIQNENKTGTKLMAVFIGVVAVVIIIMIAVALGNNQQTSSVDTNTDYSSKEYASDAVISWRSIDSVKDDYELSTPYIENEYIYIPIKVQINSYNTVQYRGFGVASINDTFSKTVPIKYEYENSTITRGVFQNLTLRIPVNDLDVKRPTTLYCQLAVFVGGEQSRINLEFDISW